jgi:hypothetical protein
MLAFYVWLKNESAVEFFDGLIKCHIDIRPLIGCAGINENFK